MGPLDLMYESFRQSARSAFKKWGFFQVDFGTKSCNPVQNECYFRFHYSCKNMVMSGKHDVSRYCTYRTNTPRIHIYTVVIFIVTVIVTVIDLVIL